MTRRDSPQQLVRRAKVVLLDAEGKNDEQIAPQTELCRKTVRTWRHRWNEQADQLTTIEAEGCEKNLRDFIINVVLADDPYNGDRCLTGPAANWPMRWSNVELSNISQSLRSGIFYSVNSRAGRFKAAQSGRLDEPQGEKS